MENITLGDISAILIFLTGFIASCILIITYAKKAIKNAIKEDLEDINSKLGNVTEEIGTTRKEGCRNFLISCFSKLQQGEELRDIEKISVHENFATYHEKGGNGYIHKEYEFWCKEGKL